jgi:hypothetical protein
MKMRAENTKAKKKGYLLILLKYFSRCETNARKGGERSEVYISVQEKSLKKFDVFLFRPPLVGNCERGVKRG